MASSAVFTVGMNPHKVDSAYSDQSIAQGAGDISEVKTISSDDLETLVFLDDELGDLVCIVLFQEVALTSKLSNSLVVP